MTAQAPSPANAPPQEAGAVDTTTKAIPDPTTDAPVFYTLPAVSLEEGMSTADGQDILDVGQIDLGVIAHVYTPADDEAENQRRRGAPEARVYKLGDRVEMGDFITTTTPGRGHPDALVRRSLPPTELRAGDIHSGLGKTIARVEASAGGTVGPGRQYRIFFTCGDPFDGNSDTVAVLRPSGVIEEVVVSELQEGDHYRNLGDQVFFDVERITEGDLPANFGDIDELVIESSSGNRAVYDSSAVVERWSPYPGEDERSQG
jgi:hypothetical protein